MAGVGDHFHSNEIMHTPLPVKPRRRCVFVIKCPDFDVKEFPLLINTDGVYVRKEGVQGTFICGVSPPEVCSNINFFTETDQICWFLVPFPCRVNLLLILVALYRLCHT